MGNAYSISGVGNYGSDPAFLYALNSYNPNFMGTQSSQYAQYLQAAQQAAAPKDTTATTPEIDPTFKGSAYGSAKSDDGPGIGTALAVAGGAAALIYAGYRGKGNPIEGVKQIWNALKSKGAKAAEGTESITQKISNLIKEKGLQECQVKNGSDLIKIKNGQVSEITARAEQKVKKLAGVSVPSGVETTSKDVILSRIERTIPHKGKNYRVILDKEGNVIEAFLGNKKVDAAGIEGLVDRAQTYTKEFAGRKVHLKDRSGNYREYTRNIELSVKNGEVTGARYKDGTGWVDIADDTTLSKLKEHFATEIPKFGTVKNGFGLTPQEYIYEYIGKNSSGKEMRYLFDGNKKVVDAYNIVSTPLTSPKKVAEYLEKHGIQDIAKTGILPEGASIASATYTTEAGNIFTIKNGKIESVKIKEACTTGKGTKAKNHSAGAVLSGNDLNAWQQALATNHNDFTVVTALL